MPVQPAALELLADLSKVLAGWGRWYLFEAQAVIAYGVPRLSADVDITVRLAPDDPDFVRRTRVMPFVHLATAMPVDVVLAASGLEDEFLDRARVVDLGGTSVPLIDPRISSSPKYWRDDPRTSRMYEASGGFVDRNLTRIGFNVPCGCSRRR